VPWKFMGGDEINGHYQIEGRDVVNGRDGASTVKLLGFEDA